MDTESHENGADLADSKPETTEEREKRTRRTYPIQVFTGSASEGWKRVGDFAFNEERDAWKWVRENGVDDVGYMLARVHGAKKIEPRKMLDAEV